MVAGFAICAAVVIAFMAISEQPARAQEAWAAACPAPPSSVEVGESFGLTAQVEPEAAASALTYRWEIENIATLTTRATGQIAYASASDAQAQRVTLFVSDDDRTQRLSCRGIVTVEAGAIVVPVGGSVQDAVDTAGPGATVYLDRGEHRDQAQILPYDDQTIRGFLGTNGTTLLSALVGTGLNVAGTRSHAITTNPFSRQSTNVTINQLEIRDYTTFGDPESAGYYGVIHIQTALSGRTFPDPECRAEGRIAGYGPSAGWEISNVWIHDNQGAGVILASDTTLRDSMISDNFHIGIGGSIAENILIDNVTVDNNARADEVLIGFHSGGLKITRTKNLQILNSRFTNNRGPGIWLDLDVHSSQVRNNVLTGNRRGLTTAGTNAYGYGLFQEVSWSSLISDNTIADNETGALLLANVAGYQRADGVTVLNVVENNRLTGSSSQIDYRDGDRTCTWLTERSVDPDKTRLPDPSPTNYGLAYNLVENNDAAAVGADPAVRVQPAPYVPRAVGGVSAIAGDVNCDNQFTLLDALLVARFAAGRASDGGACPVVAPAISVASGDVDGDGSVDATDAVAMLQCLAASESECG